MARTEDRPISSFGDGERSFPKLPIIVIDQEPATQPPRTEREKYGGLFYLGIAGLVVMTAMIAWFAYSVWRLRDVWAQVYAIHDSKRSDADRVESAVRLSHDPRVTDLQLMKICLDRGVPEKARYVLAEAISTEAVARDPRAYSLAVALSPDWPDWLRLLLARRLAYGASRGYGIAQLALAELSQHSDPMIRLWALYSEAVLPGSKSDAAAKLKEAAGKDDENGQLAARLLAALNAPPEEREGRLDEATLWLRQHHPQAKKIWR